MLLGPLEPLFLTLGRHAWSKDGADRVHVPHGVFNDGRRAANISAGRRARSSASRDTEAHTRLRCRRRNIRRSSMILEHAPFGRRGFYASFTSRCARPGRSSRGDFPAARSLHA